MNNLYRLIYTSSRTINCTDEEIDKILNSSKKNNLDRNITGVLLHSEKRFLQYLEGGKDELERLYKFIHHDDRHTGIRKHDFTEIEERMFPNWSMGYKNIEQNTLDFNTHISDKDKVVFRELIQGNEFIPDRGARLLKTFYERA